MNTMYWLILLRREQSFNVQISRNVTNMSKFVSGHRNADLYSHQQLHIANNNKLPYFPID